MAGSGAGPSTQVRGGRKTVDFSVNLVPTIDLLSVLIAFLLITAVWTQVARLRASQVPPAGPSTGPTAQEARRTLVLHLTPGHTRIAFSDDAEPRDVAMDPTGPDPGAELRVALAEYVKRAPVPAQEQAVKLQAADTVDYRSVVAALDALADHRLTAVQVGPLPAPAEAPADTLAVPPTAHPIVPHH